MHKSSGFSKFILIFMLFAIITTAAAPLSNQPDVDDPPDCGDWIIERDDKKIKVSLGRNNEDASCSASFTLENKTGDPIVGGGYSFALTTVSNAADVEYALYKGTMLVPGLILKFTATPSDPGEPASVAVYGGIDLWSYLGDAAFFLLRVGIDQILPSGSGCLISEEELALIAVQSASVLEEFGRLALSGKINATWEELAWVQDIFYKKAGDYFVDAGFDCLASMSDVVIDKAKLMSAFLIWYSSVMNDYWKAQPVINISYDFTARTRPLTT